MITFTRTQQYVMAIATIVFLISIFIIDIAQASAQDSVPTEIPSLEVNLVEVLSQGICSTYALQVIVESDWHNNETVSAQGKDLRIVVVAAITAPNRAELVIYWDPCYAGVG